MEREGSMSDGGELLLLVVEIAAAERANGMAGHPDRIAKTSDRVSRAWDAFRAFVGREQAGSGSAVEAASSQSRGLTLGAVQPAPVSCACLVQGGDPWRCARAAHRTDRIACECSCHHNRVGTPAPVSCVPTCPVRELAPEIVEYLEDLHDAHSDFLFANELAKKLRAALAAPCLGQPATDFDRAEFDVLLNEVVALREWKAAQERVLSARPRIVCLCGSSRFVPEMACIAWALERDEGYIVLSLHLLPADYPGVQPDHQAEAEGVATKMDELHLRKIDLADEVLVVNIDGYIGESTRREITYATAQKKVVRYLEPVEAKRGAPPPEGQG